MKKPVIIAFIFILILSIVNLAFAEDYRLGPGDELSISVVGYDELQVKDLVIRSDGKIAFPLAGEVQASGLTPAELTTAITTGLGSYVKDPKVTVNVTKLRTTRVYVLGEVIKPGLYEIERQHNLLDAIGIAGGYTKDAAKKKVLILRKDHYDHPVEANLLRLLKQGDMSQNYALNDGDAVFLSSNGRIDFAKDILPFMTGVYYLNNNNK